MKVESKLLTSSVIALTSQVLIASPNIILFYVDDLGWKDLSYQGSKFYETPNIDKMAKDGVVFSRAYTSHPRCLPARYSLLTGRYPARGAVWKYGGGLNPSDVTIAEALKTKNYKTFFIGKWHEIGKYGEANLPKNQGFDISLGAGAPGAPTTYFYPYRKVKLTGGLTEKDKLGLSGNVIPDLYKGGVEGEYLTDRITDESIKFIKDQTLKNPDQPFYAQICHYGVHTPFEAKKELVEKYKKKLKIMNYSQDEYEIDKVWGNVNKLRQNNPVYAAMIESIDESLGRIRKTIKELNIEKNTLIIFFSDNGGLSSKPTDSKRPLATTNYPLRNGKGWCYEGGVRLPMIACWPGKINSSTRTNSPIVVTDLYPTFLDVAGIPLHPENHIDGFSFAPLLANKDYKRPAPIFWHSPKARPYSTGDYNCSAVMQGKYKLLEWYQDSRVELFDVENDIGESKDISADYPEVKKQLLKSLHEWKKEAKVNSYKLRTSAPKKSKH